MGRKIEIDLDDILSLWHGLEDMGIHEYELAAFIPDDLTFGEIDEYCKKHMPLEKGYTKEEDWKIFKDHITELYDSRIVDRYRHLSQLRNQSFDTTTREK